jgi:fucokinase
MPAWDYLILTASHEAQARAYEGQLRLRRRLGLLDEVREVLVVADLEGRRIGSGGSTLACLVEVLNREGRGEAGAEEVLGRLRVLIVHSGGDSRRLPAYAPAGKIFLPLPGVSGPLPGALFDALVPAFLELPAPAGAGQVVVAAGDALVLFEPDQVRWAPAGVTALTSDATPEEASRHGVYCLGGGGAVRRFLQKPSPEQQRSHGAIQEAGRSPLDIGVMSFDARSAAALLETFGVVRASGGYAFSEAARKLLLDRGLDLYREICCAMGSEATLEHYVAAARAAGSTWPEAKLAAVYPSLRAIPLQACRLERCDFLHFGATGQLVASAARWLARRGRRLPPGGNVVFNTALGSGGAILGRRAWVEGCRIEARLELGGENVVTGVDVSEPLALPARACLDVQRGSSRQGKPVWFVGCYGTDDSFKLAAGEATFCGRPLSEWLRAAGLEAAQVWPEGASPVLWEAKLFPAETAPEGYRRWLWMFEPARATGEARRAYAAADRYSAAEIARRADAETFHRRRFELWNATAGAQARALE